MNKVVSKIIDGLKADKRAVSITETQIVSDRVSLTVSPDFNSDTPTCFELRFRSPKKIEDIGQLIFPMLFFKFAFEGQSDWGGLMQRALQSAVSRSHFSETLGGWVVESSVSGSDTVVQLSRNTP